MTIADALKIVLDLASGNIAPDSPEFELQEQRDTQIKAHAMVENLWIGLDCGEAAVCVLYDCDPKGDDDA